MPSVTSCSSAATRGSWAAPVRWWIRVPTSPGSSPAIHSGVASRATRATTSLVSGSSSSGLSVTTTMTGRRRRSRARNSSSSTEGTSAACRSSSTITIGRPAARSSTKEVNESNSAKRASSVSSPSPVCGSGPSGPRPSAPPGSARCIARTTCVHAQYAGAPPPSQHRPQKVSSPASPATPSAASASRVLPTPGSPESIHSEPRPAAVLLIASASSPSSCSRPTRSDDARGVGTAAATGRPRRSERSEYSGQRPGTPFSVWVPCSARSKSSAGSRSRTGPRPAPRPPRRGR